MKPLIAANWKCNPTNKKQAEKLFVDVKKGIKSFKKAEVLICPPFCYLPLLSKLKNNIELGAQDCFWEKKGAFTGEISPLMLKDLKVKYVILGHSERRRYFKETNEEINKKIKKVLKVRLKPLLCVGESQKERKEKKKAEIIEKQIKEGLDGIFSKEIKNLTLAYEPIWAIGSGENCSIDETMSSVLLIRKIIFQIYSRNQAEKIRILYGGSVNSNNSQSYIREAKTNGLLIGGASLKPKEFVKIIKSV